MQEVFAAPHHFLTSLQHFGKKNGGARGTAEV
jgi:hypothetical protein